MENLSYINLYEFYNAEVKYYNSVIRHDKDTIIALKTVSQAIYWACLFLDYSRKNMKNYQQILDEDKSKDILLALIYARNRVTHQYPQLLKITEGVNFPIVLPSPFFEIKWRSLEELPPPDKKYEDTKKAELYRKHLAEQPVRSTFGSIWYFFEKILKINGIKI